MKWIRVNSHCIRSGEYQIAKYTIMGIDQFDVRHNGELIATQGTGPNAKKTAERHARGAR